MSMEVYELKMLTYERCRAREQWPQALEAIDEAIEHCSDGYTLTRLTELRKETAEKVRETTQAKSLWAWLGERIGGKKAVKA